MNYLYYGAALASCLLIFAFLFLLRNKNVFGERLNNARLVALIYSALFFVRFLGGKPLIQETIGLNVYSPFGPQGMVKVLISAILFWLIYTVQLAAITYPFFEKHVPLVAPIARYAAAVVYAVSIAAMPILNRAQDGNLADGFHYRLLIFAIELGVGLGLALFQITKQKRPTFNLKKILLTVAILVGMLAISLPHWVPQAILGYGDDSIILNNFTTAHRLVLYGSVVFALAVHFLFAKCEYEQKRFALLYISMATMISFCYVYDFSVFTNLQDWPLHLCNTAMFIIPLVLIFKMEKLYYFTIFINVLGAFFAMIMPNLGDDVNWLQASSLQFWSNHYMAMLLPLLLMSLKLFKRPQMKQFIYSLVAFFFYYALVLFMNPWLTAQGHSVDFFFINSDFIADKLGEWAENLRDITFEFQMGDLTLLIYPVYQSLYFLVYVVLSFAMWFLYEQVFEITDTYEIITERNRKIKADRLALEAQLAGRSMQEPMNPQNEGKLILRDFSKRYSTSDVYAVYKANLEVDGGQIFGFLGPNGAGKSTIIKSIVGIQTITSGEIEVSGYDVNKQSVEAKMQIGFVPDHYALYENLTGREYINYIADLYNVPRNERDERIAEYVKRFRLETAIDNPMKTYSHGMKQKITIMSALVHNPKIWILDEPLTGLDPESIFQVKECMKEHASRGNIVFFSSHIIDVVENICDRIAIIRRGQILCTKSVAEIRESGIPLEQFYMGMIDGNTQSPVSVKEAAEREAIKGDAV
ncbi:MAG: ATP-binding cassette domain-containing protein [Ruminococcaceae bacterium]|nr:ATP-binding cassette domain-containing protein [Oscillospiraceae bacterium]